MTSTTLSGISGQTYFTSDFPDILIQAPSGSYTLVEITIDGTEVMKETLWPAGDYVRLQDMGSLLEPYAQKLLAATVAISATVDDSTSSASCTVLFARADVGLSASSFYTGHFLTIMQGERTTAVGRKELLWYYGSGAASVTAWYSDGSSRSFGASTVASGTAYSCIDVSPGNYAVSGKTLTSYAVTVGSRYQSFAVLPGQPDCAPILEFYNSFGVWEYLYCTGTHKVAPEYTRSQARVDGMLRNYRIEEKRKFEADTGILSAPMANWADELFRSDEVYVVNVIDGVVTDHDGGKEVIILDSKSEATNEDDALPHFSFTYMYAQRIQNVLQQNRVGRIFDNTFDHTFN